MSQYMLNLKMCVSIIDVHLFFTSFLRVKYQKLTKTLSKIYTGEKAIYDWGVSSYIYQSVSDQVAWRYT